jgi:catechol 2,3-dioxygenase-like lactoylglutathione lyase family enzyme
MSPKISPPALEVPTCCPGNAEPNNGTKFHFSLNVSDLERSVAFYRLLFNQPPAKHHADYAKFELEHPPLVFSLVPNPPASSGALSHFGFPVSSSDEVQSAARRLQDAGLVTTCQEGTVCGYARQDKVWVADPDHNHWEIYVVHEDVNPESVRSGYDGVSPASVKPKPQQPRAESPKESPVIWEHRVMQAVPDRIPYDDGVVDEVRLEGTFNAGLTREDRKRLLADVRRALKPGGQVLVHGLVSDQPLGTLPMLPGVASLVKCVPMESEPLEELAAAGFENL